MADSTISGLATALTGAGTAADDLLPIWDTSTASTKKQRVDELAIAIIANATAASLLAKILTVDGAGSGLDADLLDGNSAAAFALASHTHAVADLSDATANGRSLISAANYAAMRALLDLEAGTDFLSVAAIAAAYQPLDAILTDLSGITFAQGDIVYFNGTNLVNLGPGTSGQFLKTLGAAANPAWDTIPGGGDLLAANNLSDVANAATARTNLGLAIGTNVQAYDADLTTWAGLTPSANAQSLVTAADYAAMRTLLGLVIGTNVQAYDADLTTWAGLTPSANAQSLVTAANYAAMRALLDLEVGTDFPALAHTHVQADVTGLTTADSPQFAGVNVGHASDTTVTRSAAGEIAVEGKRIFNDGDRSAIGCVIDGGGATITTGIKGDIGPFTFACTIEDVTLLADQSGSIVIDIWKDSYANYPPTDADTITASAPPTISAATKSQDTTLTGWTTSIAVGDILRFNVDSITTCQRVALTMKIKRT